MGYFLSIITKVDNMKFYVTSNGKPDYFEGRVSVGDVVKYELDFTPWLENKGTFVSADWSLLDGSAGIVEDDTDATITFGSTGVNVISCLVTSSSGEKKKVWLIIKVEEPNI